jgi:nucleotide-binding universal stress UspA family protein
MIAMEDPMHRTKDRVTSDQAAAAATYQTLLVHAEPGLAATNRVEVAVRLARSVGARLVGLGAEMFEPITFAEPYAMAASADWATLLMEQVQADLKAAEVAFLRDSAGADVIWRVIEDYPSRALCNSARLADLIIVGPKKASTDAHSADPAEVVMGAGRPVLIVPDGRNHLLAAQVLIAWKDTRECRRAIADAMPFLLRAEEVIVHGVADAGSEERVQSQIADVLSNLKGHGVSAMPVVSTADDHSVAEELERVAALYKVDLIVAGGYGHTRLREWAFGGVTEHLLSRPAQFVLMSH